MFLFKGAHVDIKARAVAATSHQLGPSSFTTGNLFSQLRHLSTNSASCMITVMRLEISCMSECY